MSSDCRDVDEDPVACVEVELGGTLDDQSGDVRWKDCPHLDHSRPAAKVDVHCPEYFVKEPNGKWSHNPKPALRGVIT